MNRIFFISFCIIILAFLIAGCTQFIRTGSSIFVPADDAGIQYTGRIDFSNPKAVRFDWPGILISANFEGPYIGARIVDGKNDYNIFIDGKQTGVMVTKPGIKEYTLADNISAGGHLLVLSKRTEGYDGVAVFEGLLLDKGAKLLPPPGRLKRRIEYIGDSLAVGYGVEGPGIKCPSEREFKNNWKAFSAVAARELNAEYQIAAISGRGLVKNYGEKTDTSAEPLSLYYDRTLQNDPKIKWDFKSWTPDAVVINLGTNDFSAPPVPDEGVFVKSYVKLIKTVRANYPDAAIFCCNGPAQASPFNRYFVEVLDSFKDKKLYRVDMNKLTDIELGCDWHPNEAAAKRLAQELTAEIKPVMGW